MHFIEHLKSFLMFLFDLSDVCFCSLANRISKANPRQAITAKVRRENVGHVGHKNKKKKKALPSVGSS
jgi:GTP1/Obg family GTP-binding protein